MVTFAIELYQLKDGNIYTTPYHIDQAMKARYNYRIYPKNHQLEALAKAMGCARVVWNDALWLYKKAEIEGTDRPKNKKILVQSSSLKPKKLKPENGCLKFHLWCYSNH